jgi:LysM repeat protein
MKRMLVGPVLLGAALAFSACGSTATGTTSSVVNLQATNYHTLPPTITTLPPSLTSQAPGQSVPPGVTFAPGSVTTAVTTYKVQKGDVPSAVARRFGITLDALVQANTDTPNYASFYVGLTIKIPAGATVPTSSTTTTQPLPDLTKGTVKGNCVRGTYTVQKGDLPGTVAKKFNLTRAQLDAANASTKGYSGFIVGIKIIIPAATGCTG